MSAHRSDEYFCVFYSSIIIFCSFGSFVLRICWTKVLYTLTDAFVMTLLKNIVNVLSSKYTMPWNLENEFLLLFLIAAAHNRSCNTRIKRNRKKEEEEKCLLLIRLIEQCCFPYGIHTNGPTLPPTRYG